MAVTQVVLDAQSLFPGAPDFDSAKTKTKTESGEKGEKKNIDTTKQVRGEDLIKFGQLLTGVPQGAPPMAAPNVGGASQVKPILPGQFAPDINTMLLLAKLLGVQ